MKKNENDRLYERLKNLMVPEIANPEHERALRERLEKMIAEQERPRPAIRPFSVVAGALAAAAAAAVALVLVLRPPGGAAVDLAADERSAVAAPAVLSLSGGDVTAQSGGVTERLALGSALKPGDTVSVSGHAPCEFQIDERVFLRLDPSSAFVFRGAWSAADGTHVSVELRSGTAVVHDLNTDGYLTVYTPFAVFQTVGTAFLVRVEHGRSAALAVGEGRVRVLSLPPRTAILREGVGAGRSVSVDSSGALTDRGAVSEEDGLKIDEIRKIAFLPDPSRRRSVRVTVVSEPADATIAVDGVPRGRGTLFFLAAPGVRYTVTASGPGRETQSRTESFQEDKTIAFRLKRTIGPPKTPERTSVPETRREIEASPVPGRDGGAVVLPTASPELTGRVSDWHGLAPVIADPSGDMNASDAGTDISDVFLAHDETFLFFGIKFENGTLDPGVQPEIALSLAPASGRRVELSGRTADKKWLAEVKIFKDGALASTSDAAGKIVVGDGFLEMKLPLEAVLSAGTPGEIYKAKATLTIQKYGRLRVIADETEARTVLFY
ncbi:MAG: hypothetical protein JXD23_09555 [Spirochaetales bacterium]|nr:hypothetical protein [Spirochaetales bacterium]